MSLTALGNARALSKPAKTIASAATLILELGVANYSITGSTPVTSIPTDSYASAGRKIMFTGATGAAAVFTNTNSPTVAGQMNLHGSNVTLLEGDVLILELQTNRTWNRVVMSI